MSRACAGCSGAAVITAITPRYPLTVLTRPTAVQLKAFNLLGVAV
jgi:hypothetical protein